VGEVGWWFGEDDGKGRAHTGFAGDPDVSSMGIDDLFSDRQTQSRSLVPVALAAFDLVELVE